MKMVFEEESCLTAVGQPIPGAAEAVGIGMACAAAARSETVRPGESLRIFVAHSGERGARVLAGSFAAGCAQVGCEVLIGGECSAWAAASAVRTLGCFMGCHIHTEITPVFRLFAGDGLSLYARTEDKITAALYPVKSKGKAPDDSVPYSHYGVIREFAGADEMYISSLRSRLHGELHGIYADVYSPSAAVSGEAMRALSGNGDQMGERIAFHIGSDGGRVSAFSESTGYVFRDKLLMLCCRGLFERGIDAAFCGSVPRWLEKMAEGCGRRVISCGRNVCTDCSDPSEECSHARLLAAEQGFTRDGIALMMETLETLRSRGETLKDAVASLPPTAVINRYIPADRPSALLKRLCSPDSKPGVLSDSSRGLVTIRPVRTGKGLMLGVESFSMEAAAELCDIYEGNIRKLASCSEL